MNPPREEALFAPGMEKPLENRTVMENEALDQPAVPSPVEAQVEKLRFIVGMTAADSAEVPGLSERTVKQYWSHAKTWLYGEIRSKKA
jgi:hypothetical protein